MIMTPNCAIEIGSSAHDVLRLLFEHGSQRQGEIAERLAITKAACNQHFRRLADDGLIAPGDELANQRGRPSQLWHIHDQGNYFLGVMFYGGEISVTLIDFAGRLVHQEVRTPADCGDRELLLREMDAMVAGACCQVREWKGRILQTFAAAGGVLETDGTMISSPYMSGLNGVNLETELSERFGLRTYCDATHYTYAQGESSDLPPTSTALIINWDEGFGGVVTCNRQLLMWSGLPSQRNRGLWNLGHVPVVRDGVPCYCGQKGCLEAYVGGDAIPHRHPELGCRGEACFLELAAQGDPRALAVLNDAARLIGASMYWVIELFGVDTIIFVGSFSVLFRDFEAGFRAGLEEMRTPEAAGRLRVLASDDPRQGMRLGAALMARHFFFYPDAPRASRGVYRPGSISEAKERKLRVG